MIESLDSFHQLVAETGSMEEEILVVTRTADGACAIRFEDIDILAHWDPARERVVLSAPIGAPPPDRTAEIYETLLAYNSLWRETGGLRIALTGRGGDAVQLVDLAGDEIGPKQLATVAANMAERTRIWRAYFALGLGEAAEPAAAEDFSIPMIRA